MRDRIPLEATPAGSAGRHVRALTREPDLEVRSGLFLSGFGPQ